MKPSLLALAALASFASPATAQSHLTLYGVVDAGINWTDDGSAKTWGLESGNHAGSRLGVKGTEDLGSGLKGVFVLEHGFNTDDGTAHNDGRVFGRQAWAGLQGGFGEVRLGRQELAFKNAVDEIDPFGGTGQLGLWDAVGYAPGFASGEPDRRGAVLWAERADNVVGYLSPEVGGFTAAFHYVFGERADSNSLGRQISLGLGYSDGPWKLQAGYHRAHDARIEFESFLSDVDPLALSEVAGDVKASFVGATYDFEVAKAHAGLAETRAEYRIAGTEDKIRNAMLGLTLPFGASKLLVSYIRNDVRKLDAANSDQLGLGYVYSLSKRTALYAQYARVRNEANANLAVRADGDSGNRVAAGIMHKF